MKWQVLKVSPGLTFPSPGRCEYKAGVVLQASIKTEMHLSYQMFILLWSFISDHTSSYLLLHYKQV